MWEIGSKYLHSDEKIKYLERPSMAICIISGIWIGSVVGCAMFMATLNINENSGDGFTGVIVMSFLPLLIPGICIILKNLSTRYAISNRGLLKRVGILTTSIKTIPFKHITSIEVRETIIGKLLGYAHLLIDTSGSGHAIESRWEYVTAAYEVKKLIEKNISGI